MGIRRSGLLSAGLSAVIVILAMSGAGIQASASTVPGPNFSTLQGIDAYLQSRGINPGAAIWQTGLDNYVGDSCPGAGWHCHAPTHTPVVQIAPAGGVNVFNCSPGTGSGSCFVLQISAGAPAATAGNPPPVTNKFSCNEQSSANPAVLDAATCGALVQSNTNGNNQATIAQSITQKSGASQGATETAGSPGTPFSQTNMSGQNLITIAQSSAQSSSNMPTSAQTIYVSQANTSGQNSATVQQLEQQQVSNAASAQDQEGTQVACVTQDSLTGPNAATVSQLMNQSEADSASGITQVQNKNPGPQSTCGTGTASTSVNPNLAALVLQNQNTPAATGQNQMTVGQSLRQQQQSTASSGSVTQQQGPSPRQGGLEAIPDQTSTGLSTLGISQNENQNMTASTTGTLSQTQNDPIRQPDCSGTDCSQSSNPNDTFTLTQTGVQQAGPQAQQNFFIQGDCATFGTCKIQSTDTSNGVTTTQSQSCTGSSEGPCTTSTSVRPPVPASFEPGFTSNLFPANDDNSTGPISLPFPVTLFGTTYNSLFLNNNGNVTFTAPMSAFTPSDLSTVGQAIVAPFWADVDTDFGGQVTYGSGSVAGHPAFGVNWNAVSCFATSTAGTDSFQLVLIDRSDVAPGALEIEFNYGSIQWDSGQASGGDSTCRNGTAAVAGYSDGSSAANTFELPGSFTDGAFLDGGPDALATHSANSTVQGRYDYLLAASGSA
jgi:nidogen-like